MSQKRKWTFQDSRWHRYKITFFQAGVPVTVTVTAVSREQAKTNVYFNRLGENKLQNPPCDDPSINYYDFMAEEGVTVEDAGPVDRSKKDTGQLALPGMP